MTTISILYPAADGVRFDFTYYVEKHMPRAIELLGKHAGYHGVSVERGMAGSEPGAPPAYVALCHWRFDSIEAFLEAFMPVAEELQGDMANYTTVMPVIQFNDVLIAV